MKKRGQGATEYLIILSVVVIIILIVIGLLGGIPAVRKSSASEIYWESADVGISDYSLSAGTDILFLTLKNNLDTSIHVQSITVNDAVNASVAIPLNPGAIEATSVTMDCTTEGDAFDLSPIIIYYSDLSTGANYTFTGTVSLSGQCIV